MVTSASIKSAAPRSTTKRSAKVNLVDYLELKFGDVIQNRLKVVCSNPKTVRHSEFISIDWLTPKVTLSRSPNGWEK